MSLPNKRSYVLGFPDIIRGFYSFNDYFRNLFADIILQQNGFLLHASSVEHNSIAYVFTGDEGAGKSTLANLFPKSLHRGDDIVLIRKVGKTVYSYGSPFYQKTRRAYPNTKAAVGGIYTLHHTAFQWITPASPESLPRLLLGNALIGHKSPTNTKAVFTNVLGASKALRGFHLCFRPDATICPLVYGSLSLPEKPPGNQRIVRNINEAVRTRLPSRLHFKIGLTLASELQDMYIINEPAWSFEIGPKQTVQNAAITMNSPGFGSRHKNRVVALRKKGVLSLAKKPFVGMRNGTGITLMDGNHAAIALVSLMRQDKKKPNPTVKLLLAEYRRSFPFLN